MANVLHLRLKKMPPQTGKYLQEKTFLFSTWCVLLPVWARLEIILSAIRAHLCCVALGSESPPLFFKDKMGCRTDSGKKEE